MTEHKPHISLILQRVLENKVIVKAEKCEFHVTSISALSFIIDQGKIKSDPAKIQAVTERPTPSSHKQLQCFLVFANILPPISKRL